MIVSAEERVVRKGFAPAVFYHLPIGKKKTNNFNKVANKASRIIKLLINNINI